MSNDTIKKLKENLNFIEKPEKINLIFDNINLENYKTLNDYYIREESTIYVEILKDSILFRKINILTYNDKIIELNYEENETIEDLKKQIKEKEKFPIYQQKLLYKGLYLENNRTLSSYDIKGEEILNLKIFLEIFIKYNQKEIKLFVEPYNMIETIKRKILDTEGIPIKKQKLIFNNKELEDSKNIFEYEIKEGNFIDLVLLEEKCNKIIKIYIKIKDEKTEFNIEEGEKIDIIKLKIQEKKGIPINKQKIIFKGKILKENKPLFEYNIRDGDTILLFQNK